MLRLMLVRMSMSRSTLMPILPSTATGRSPGNLSTYQSVFDILDSDFSAFRQSWRSKIPPGKKDFGIGVSLLAVDNERLSRGAYFT